MLWWVFNRTREMNLFSDIVCAIDDDRIREVCDKYGMSYLMTKDDHPNHIARVHEVSNIIDSDYYVCINGDEPLIKKQCIIPIIPNVWHEEPYFSGAMRELRDPVETIDPSNIKLAVSESTGKCLYMSRAPIPYPKGTLLYSYQKYVGVECFNKSALDFFVSHRIGRLEQIEDIDHLRFLENGVDLHFFKVESESISVDTYKDLEKVRVIIASEMGVNY